MRAEEIDSMADPVRDPDEPAPGQTSREGAPSVGTPSVSLLFTRARFDAEDLGFRNALVGTVRGRLP